MENGANTKSTMYYFYKQMLKTELDEFIPTLNAPLTPWFQLILKHRLRHWWEHLNNLDEIKDHEKIVHLKF
ncbi:hypothetical protein NQ318_008453 [Aromia moschata]|uniref:Uncharacterized protein n=1 Tax=Aromia moschata TaxID=1265417 RepID=A0AAV8YCH6_9CUCU|nr:hypothetical protein NQ318_008453 [Aromia moschata]